MQLCLALNDCFQERFDWPRREPRRRSQDERVGEEGKEVKLPREDRAGRKQRKVTAQQDFRWGDWLGLTYAASALGYNLTF